MRIQQCDSKTCSEQFEKSEISMKMKQESRQNKTKN